VTAELKNPARDLPRAIFFGIPAVMIIYVFANVAYLAILPVDKMVDWQTGSPNEGEGGGAWRRSW
jgi:amino acid transporter